MILAIIVAYVLHIPFAVRSKRWVAAHPEAWDDKPTGTPRHPAGDSPRSAAPPIHVAARTAQTGCRCDRPWPHRQLTLTARLNTSALDSRRGVVRLHPEAIAALGIREWDAVSLTGSRTTAAVAGLAPEGTPAGTALLDDVTLSNAGLREDTSVIVAPVTVYGARSVTLSGSTLATQSVSSATLRQALLGKVMTVGDTVSLLPRDLGPGTSTSEASARAGVGGRHHLDLGTADRDRGRPRRPGERAAELRWSAGAPASLPNPLPPDESRSSVCRR